MSEKAGGDESSRNCDALPERIYEKVIVLFA